MCMFHTAEAAQHWVPWDPSTIFLATSFTQKMQKGSHCVRSVPIWSYSGLNFPAFGLNTMRYRISLLIQCECGKIRTRITQNTDNFSLSVRCHVFLHFRAGKHMIWQFYLNWIKFPRNFEFCSKHWSPRTQSKLEQNSEVLLN